MAEHCTGCGMNDEPLDFELGQTLCSWCTELLLLRLARVPPDPGIRTRHSGY